MLFSATLETRNASVIKKAKKIRGTSTQPIIIILPKSSVGNPEPNTEIIRT